MHHHTHYTDCEKNLYLLLLLFMWRSICWLLFLTEWAALLLLLPLMMVPPPPPPPNRFVQFFIFESISEASINICAKGFRIDVLHIKAKLRGIWIISQWFPFVLTVSRSRFFEETNETESKMLKVVKSITDYIGIGSIECYFIHYFCVFSFD